MPKYKKKPIVIEAVQFDGNFRCLEVFDEYEIRDFIVKLDNQKNICIQIPTLEGVMTATKGDYIIREPFPSGDRQFYPCKPDIFEATYIYISE